MRRLTPRCPGIGLAPVAVAGLAGTLHRMIKYLSLALIALSLADHPSRAQDLTTPIEPAALPKPDVDGFITLFNGRNLAGWTGLAEYWSVRDGSISGHQTKDMSKQTLSCVLSF
jgi:hypothetical protein